MRAILVISVATVFAIIGSSSVVPSQFFQATASRGARAPRTETAPLIDHLARVAERSVKVSHALRGLRELNQEISKKSAFSPPPDGTVSVHDVECFVYVQQAMYASVGNDSLGFATGTRLFVECAFPNVYGIGHLLSGSEYPELEIAPRILKAKQAQVRALNEKGLSLAKYRWIRECMYRALDGADRTLYVEDLVDDIAARNKYDQTHEPQALRNVHKGPMVNIRLAQAARRALEYREAYGVVGL